jgi:16S rRNA (guanine966-N2)-methyltransferase
MTGEIRIIGGKFKGKKIKVCDINDLRPTSNRIRESLFNILQFEIKGSVCLDAFAGSGAIGIEALSRGASHVTFLEPHPKAFETLKMSLMSLQTNEYDLYKKDCIDFLNSTTQKFDIIFIDPPFRKDFWQACLDIIYDKELLNSDGLVYLESPQPLDIDSSKWEAKKTNRMSDVYFGIYKFVSKS